MSQNRSDGIMEDVVSMRIYGQEKNGSTILSIRMDQAMDKHGRLISHHRVDVPQETCLAWHTKRPMKASYVLYSNLSHPELFELKIAFSKPNTVHIQSGDGITTLQVGQ